MLLKTVYWEYSHEDQKSKWSGCDGSKESPWWFWLWSWWRFVGSWRFKSWTADLGNCKQVQCLLGYCLTTLLGSYCPILTRDLLCLHNMFNHRYVTYLMWWQSWHVPLSQQFSLKDLPHHIRSHLMYRLDAKQYLCFRDEFCLACRFWVWFFEMSGTQLFQFEPFPSYT